MTSILWRAGSADPDGHRFGNQGSSATSQRHSRGRTIFPLRTRLSLRARTWSALPSTWAAEPPIQRLWRGPLKIPAVTGLERVSRVAQTGDTIITDGSTGIVILNPDPEMIFRYRQRQDVYRTYHESLMAYGRLPAVTRDGRCSVRITANIELADEVGDRSESRVPKVSVCSGPNTCFSDGRIFLPKKSNLKRIAGCLWQMPRIL